MVNFGLLAAEIDPVVWSTLASFNGFRVLAALLHCVLACVSYSTLTAETLAFLAESRPIGPLTRCLLTYCKTIVLILLVL